jgi:hypothetical protein
MLIDVAMWGNFRWRMDVSEGTCADRDMGSDKSDVLNCVRATPVTADSHRKSYPSKSLGIIFLDICWICAWMRTCEFELSVVFDVRIELNGIEVATRSSCSFVIAAVL